MLSAGKLAVLALFVSIAVALVIYLKVRDTLTDVGPETPKLQGRVVAVFNNTRYAHEVGGRVRFVLTAGVDRTYQDGTHELEQVRLESSGAEGEQKDIVTADRAHVSDPSDLNKLDVEFISNVVVETANGLKIKTSYLHYDQAKNIIDTKEPVEFEGETFAGRSTGAIVEATDERVHLLKDVDVTIKPEAGADGDKSPASDKADRKKSNKASEDKAARKARKRARRAARKSDGKSGSSSDKIAGSKPTRIRAASALLEKIEHRVTFEGGVIINQGADEMRASRMLGHLDTDDRIERIEARSNAYLKQGDRAEIHSSDMDFFFEGGNSLSRATASGGARVRSLGPEPLREARAQTIEATFVEGPQGNAPDTIKGQGGASLFIDAPAPANEQDNPARRELAADTISMQFFPDGRNIKTAEATDNAIMTVTPVRAAQGADKKTISAPLIRGDFYEEGNRLKSFNATGGVKVEIEPTVKDDHPVRTTTSRELAAEFAEDSQDLDLITQQGDFKYNEGDRNALAERAAYDGRKELLRLRGKRPVAWDAKSRLQADEIDYDHKNDLTHGRGDVRTTYYNPESTGDATPFDNSKSPVFITSERVEARNKEGIAVYTINARGWQDDNFIKADRIELYREEKRMVATGNVESALYTLKRATSPGQREVVPGFASAERMTYSDKERLIHYEGGAQVRQGTDKIEASAIDAYLKKETSEVERMTAEGKVVLTQPNRRGTGDRLAYNAEDGLAVLTGESAQVVSSEHGTVMGARLTFHSRDDKIAADNQQGAGRVRSTHRLTKKH